MVRVPLPLADADDFASILTPEGFAWVLFVLPPDFMIVPHR
jgi:hypothetical protein